jgi:putative DNA primase/helicase
MRRALSRLSGRGFAVDSLTHALDLWRRGLSIFPVPRPDATHDGKRPVIAWKDYQTRRATEAEVRAWFARPSNVGIVCGAISGVVVIDGDSPEALRWLTRRVPYTPWQVRTSRGFHLYLTHPGVPVRNRARIETGEGRLAIDVRGDGGFVIAPGSIHASGVEYREAGDWRAPIEALPMFDPAWLAVATPRPAQTPPRVRPSGNVADRARRYLSRVPVPEIGCGSDAATLRAAATLVRGFGLDERTTLELLDDWAGGRPGWDRRWLAQKITNAVRFGSEPIGGRL